MSLLVCVISGAGVLQKCGLQKLVKKSRFVEMVKFFRRSYCCGATVGSEQQHNQDLREIYTVGRILEFITFYHNALHLTTLFTTMHCI